MVRLNENRVNKHIQLFVAFIQIVCKSVAACL